MTRLLTQIFTEKKPYKVWWPIAIKINEIFCAFCEFLVKIVQEKIDNKNNHVVGIYVKTLSNNFIKYH